METMLSEHFYGSLRFKIFNKIKLAFGAQHKSVILTVLTYSLNT